MAENKDKKKNFHSVVSGYIDYIPKDYNAFVSALKSDPALADKLYSDLVKLEAQGYVNSVPAPDDIRTIFTGTTTTPTTTTETEIVAEEVQTQRGSFPTPAELNKPIAPNQPLPNVGVPPSNQPTPTAEETQIAQFDQQAGQVQGGMPQGQGLGVGQFQITDIRTQAEKPQSVPTMPRMEPIQQTTTTPTGQATPLTSPPPEQVGFMDYLGNAVQRGMNRGEIADYISATGKTPTAEEFARIAELNAENERLFTSKAMRDFSSNPDLESTLKSLPEIAVESIASLYRHGLARMATGAVAGGVAGSVIPAAGTLAGAGTGILSGMSVAGLGLEVSGTIMEGLNELKINTKDPEALKTAFSNSAVMDYLKQKAYARGIPIAVINAVSMGVAGKLLGKPVASAVGRGLQVLGEAGIQGVLGASGEAYAQMFSGEKFKPYDILAEGLAEIPGSIPEVGIAVLSKNKGAGKDTKVESARLALKSPDMSTEAINEVIDVGVGTGEINATQATELKQEVAKAREINAKIPAEIKDTELRVTAIGLIEERDNLTAQLETVDEAFKPAIQEKIKGINEQLQELSQIPQQQGTQAFFENNQPSQTNPLLRLPESVDAVMDKIDQGILVSAESLYEVYNNVQTAIRETLANRAITPEERSATINILSGMLSDIDSANKTGQEFVEQVEAVSVQDRLPAVREGVKPLPQGQAPKGTATPSISQAKAIREENKKKQAGTNVLPSSGQTIVTPAPSTTEAVATETEVVPEGTITETAISETPQSEVTAENPALADVESTAKALEGQSKKVEKILGLSNEDSDVLVIINNADLTPTEKKILWRQYKAGVMNLNDIKNYSGVIDLEKLNSEDIGKWARAEIEKQKSKRGIFNPEYIEFENIEISQNESKANQEKPLLEGVRDGGTEGKAGQESSQLRPKETGKEEVGGIETQIENFGVSKENVKPVSKVIGKVFETLKKAGLTTAKTVGDWVGIGKGEEKTYSLKINGKDTEVRNVSPEVVNGFYSPLEKTINETKLDKLPAKQWADKFGKSEEAKWTGLADWLAQQTGSVSKAEIQQFLKDNRIQVVEVVKGELGGDTWTKEGNSYFSKNREYEIRDLGEDGFELLRGKYNLGSVDSLEMAKENAIEDGYSNDKNITDDTKFSQWQLEGEKDNYKEVLVTMPVKHKNLAEYAESKGISSDELNYKLPKDKVEKLRSEFNSLSNFQSTHFDEPNILVHLRMNTRTDADGNKVLFLEEVQSDWGQKGKKEGFTDTNFTEQDSKRIKELNNKFDTEGLSQQEMTELTNLKRKEKGISLTPTAPFVTDTNAWTKLGLKVALKEAVKQGADKIAWTTGEQQNERYDLSKQVDKIEVPFPIDNYRQISIFMNSRSGGETIDVVVNNEGKVIEGDKKYLGESLENIVGKDIAEKIMSSEKGKTTTLEGEGLKIGGKGMKGFYGSPTEGSLGIVGNVAKSLFKQEPRTVEINAPKIQKSEDGFYYITGVEEVFNTKPDAENYIKENAGDFEGDTQHSIDITPELIASVEGGQPLFKDAQAQYRIENGKNIVEAIKDFNGTPEATVALTHEIMHPTVVSIIDGAKEGNSTGKKHTQTILSEYNKANPDNKVSTEELVADNDKFKAGETTDKYRAVQEFIADSWEKYHTQGAKGFSKPFQEVLNQITEAFKAVYKTISGKDITPELRQMFDEILGKETAGQEGGEAKGETLEEKMSKVDFDKLISEQESKTPEQKETERQEAIEKDREEEYQKSSFDKKWAKTYKQAKEKLVEQYNKAKKAKEEWESKNYKSAGDKSVFVGGELEGKDVSVDRINQRRKENGIKNAQSEMDSAKSDLVRLGLSDTEVNELLSPQPPPATLTPVNATDVETITKIENATEKGRELALNKPTNKGLKRAFEAFQDLSDRAKKAGIYDGKTLKIGGQEITLDTPAKFKAFLANQGNFDAISEAVKGVESEQKTDTNPSPKTVEEKSKEVFNDTKSTFVFPIGLNPKFKFDSRLPENVVRFFKKYFRPRGLWTKGMFAAKRGMENQISAQQKRTEFAVKDLKQAVNKAYPKGITNEQLSAINDFLQGYARELPANLYKPIEKMREHIDELSRLMISEGIIDERLVPVFDANMGIYTTRTYAIHNDPEKWIRYINEQPEGQQIRNNAVNFVRQATEAKADRLDKFADENEKRAEKLFRRAELAEGDEALMLQAKADEVIARADRQRELASTMREQDFDAQIDAFLFAEGQPLDIIRKGNVGAKDLGVLKKRKNIPDEFRALMGEEKDPLTNYTMSVAKMSALIANNQFLNEVKAQGLASGLFSKKTPKGKNIVQIASASTDSMSPLNGLYTTKDIAEAFKEFDANIKNPWYVDAMLWVNAVVKIDKTVLSEQAVVRNFLGNPIIELANGYIPTFKGRAINTQMEEILNRRFGDKADVRGYIERLTKLGVLGQGGNYREIQAIYEDLKGNKYDYQKLIEPAIKKARKETWNILQKIYKGGDEFWKVVAFENERAVFEKAYGDTKTDEELDEMTATKIRRTRVDYSMAPKAVKVVNKFPFAGTFVTFPAEIIRIGANIPFVAYEEMNSGNKVLRDHGIKRMAGYMTAMTLSYGLSELTRYLAGMDDEEEEARKQFLAPWTQNSTLAWVDKNTYVDTGFSDAFSILKKPIVGFIRGADFVDGSIQAVKEFLGPLISEEIGYKTYESVKNNRDEYDNPIYDENAEYGTKVSQIASYVLKKVEPGTVSQIRRLYLGETGALSEKGQKYSTTDEVTNATFGIKRVTVDWPNAVSFKFRDGVEKINNSNKFFLKETKELRKNDVEGRRKAAESTNLAIENTYNDLRKYYTSAIKIGMLPKNVEDIMRESGVSNELIDAVVNNTGYNNYLLILNDGTVLDRQTQRQLKIKR